MSHLKVNQVEIWYIWHTCWHGSS